MMNFLALGLSNLLRGDNLLLIIMGIVSILILILMIVRRDKLNCIDLVVGPDGKLSVENIGQLCGLLVAVWTPVYMAVQGHLDAVILSICLGYLGSVHAYSKYLQLKSGASNDPPSTPQ